MHNCNDHNHDKRVTFSKKVQEDLLNQTGELNTTRRENMDFTTELQSKHISVSRDHSSYPSSECDYQFTDAIINWDMEIEARSWGVKNIYPFVRNVTLEVEIYEYTDDEDKLVETIEIAEELGWKYDNEFASKGDGLCPQEIYIDFAAKKIEIEF